MLSKKDSALGDLFLDRTVFARSGNIATPETRRVYAYGRMDSIRATTSFAACTRQIIEIYPVGSNFPWSGGCVGCAPALVSRAPEHSLVAYG
jgi:hypothetical protein